MFEGESEKSENRKPEAAQVITLLGRGFSVHPERSGDLSEVPSAVQADPQVLPIEGVFQTASRPP